MFTNWLEVYNTCNLSPDKEMDAVSKWLIIIRVCVFSMTLTSAFIGGILALGSGSFAWFPFLLATVGLLLAHAANNMINDYFDLQGGVDDDAYTRALYAPHPVLSGLVTRGELLRAIIIVNLVDAAIMLYLTWSRGWPVLVFALLGLFVSVFYVAPPLRLKHRGLGELGVLIVWAPLMVGGTYYVAAGSLPAWVLVASLPYGLLVMTVLVGKHVDKLEQDRAKGINTLPVLLGSEPSRRLNQALMIAFYLIVLGLVLTGTLGIWPALVLLAVPLLLEVLKAYNRPKPEVPPEDYPVWPLWFVSLAFAHTRRAGALFILGLILNQILPISLF
jgi:1,4-dihydroxy-2-naphthoate octaprenyltransferase